MFFVLFLTKTLFKNFDQIRLGKRGRGGGGTSCPLSLLNLKRELEL